MTPDPQPPAWIILPAEPTEEMLTTASAEDALAMAEGPEIGAKFDPLYLQRTWWRAMLSARPALTDDQVEAMARAHHEATAERQMMRWDALPGRYQNERIAAMRAALKALETI